MTYREKYLLIILGVFMLGAFLLVNILQISILTFNAWLHAHEPQLILAFLPLGLYFAVERK